MKKEELAKSYESKYSKENKDIISQDNNIKIEFSNNEIVEAKLTDLIKYPYSKLASYFSSLSKMPKRNNNIFLDKILN